MEQRFTGARDQAHLSKRLSRTRTTRSPPCNRCGRQRWVSASKPILRISTNCLRILLRQRTIPMACRFWGIAWIADYPDPQDWTTLQFDKGVPNNNINYGQNTLI